MARAAAAAEDDSEVYSATLPEAATAIPAVAAPAGVATLVLLIGTLGVAVLRRSSWRCRFP